ncbi:F-box domain-containing protein [Aphelenchoides fujianensis]|nr:F-box domain-containing protein [Aphelenchoides fujianensis]
MPSVWTLKSLVLFLNAGKRKKRERLNGERKSAKSLLRRSRKGEDAGEEVVLTDEIWSMVCDHLSPLDVLRMRRVNQQLKRVVDERLHSLIYIDFLRCESMEISDETEFHRVNRNRNLYVQMDERCATVVVDERMTSRDVPLVFDAIKFFAPYARCVNIDVSLAELCVAGLSSVKLSRWFAFQCYVNALGEGGHELHMKVGSEKHQRRDVLFPKMTELTIRAMPADVNHLSRLGDYGIGTEALFSEDVIQLVRCLLLEPIGRLSKCERIGPRQHVKRRYQHLRAFKSWIDSTQLGEKYVQSYV